MTANNIISDPVPSSVPQEENKGAERRVSPEQDNGEPVDNYSEIESAVNRNESERDLRASPPFPVLPSLRHSEREMSPRGHSYPPAAWTHEIESRPRARLYHSSHPSYHRAAPHRAHSHYYPPSPRGYSYRSYAPAHAARPHRPGMLHRRSLSPPHYGHAYDHPHSDPHHPYSDPHHPHNDPHIHTRSGYRGPIHHRADAHPAELYHPLAQRRTLRQPEYGECAVPRSLPTREVYPDREGYHSLRAAERDAYGPHYPRSRRCSDTEYFYCREQNETGQPIMDGAVQERAATIPPTEQTDIRERSRSSPRPLLDHPQPPAPTRSTSTDSDSNKGCSCRKTKCLKLYCQCFAASMTCNPKVCQCDGCLNTEEESKKGGAVASARRAVLGRNPSAFEDKFCLTVVKSDAQATVGTSRSIPRLPQEVQFAAPGNRSSCYDSRPSSRLESEYQSFDQQHPSPPRSMHRFEHTDPDRIVKGVIPADSNEVTKTNLLFEKTANDSNKDIPPKQEVMASRNAHELPLSSAQPSHNIHSNDNRDGALRKVHRVGCKCRKSQCLKKYCECFQNNSKCGLSCRCINCGNRPEGVKSVTTPDAPSTHLPVPSDKASAVVSSDSSRSSYNSQDGESIQDDSKATRPPSVLSPASEVEKEKPSDVEEPEAQIKTEFEGLPKPTSENRMDFLAALAMSALKTYRSDAKPDSDKDTTTLEKKRKTEDSNISNEEVANVEPPPKRFADPNRSSLTRIDEPTFYDSRAPTEPRNEGLSRVHVDVRPSHYRHHFPPSERDHYHYPYDERNRHTNYRGGRWPLEAHPGPPVVSSHSASQQFFKPIAAIKQEHNKQPSPQFAPPIEKPGKLPKGLTYRKVCSHCGRQRAEHGEFGFGNKCPFTTCGRCGAHANLHENKRMSMGITCRLTVEDGAQPGSSRKYDMMITDLAARAELRAEMGKNEQNDKLKTELCLPLH